jgi:hypothetical protein
LIDARAGEVMVVTMASRSALQPLIGILDPDGTLVGRSEDGAAGSTVTLEYTAQADGVYTIVATRVGNENGTSTGEYELQVRRANTPVEQVNPYQEVTFRCQDYEVTNAVTLEWSDDQASFYRTSVYGMDGFSPAIRVVLSTPELTDCSSDSQAMGGDRYTLPGAETVNITAGTPDAAQLTISGAGQAGVVTLTIGSIDGSTGRYMAIIEGFSIDPADDIDLLRIGHAPKAALTPLLVYMVADKSTRLDPAILAPDEPTNSGSVVCDDAGRRGCEAVASVDGLNVLITAADAEDVEIVGGRFDAGALFPIADPEQQLRVLELGSFSGNTQGGYTLVVIGELTE